MAERPLDRWARLRSSGKGDGAIEVPSIASGVQTGFGPVRFALDSRGRPRLLVPCGPGSSLPPGISTDNLVIAISRFDVAGESAMFLDVSCTSPSLDGVFAEFAEEVLHRVEAGQSPVRAVASTIDDFRRLLQEVQPFDIGEQQIVGLLGELVVLRSLVEIAPAATSVWSRSARAAARFPSSRARHRSRNAIRADATKISISSAGQLAEPAHGTLTLAHVTMERADAGRLFVSALYAEIVGHGADRRSLDSGLSAVGCADPQSPAWNRLRCELDALTGYEDARGISTYLPGQFAHATLPDGVEWLNYVVDWGRPNLFAWIRQRWKRHSGG